MLKCEPVGEGTHGGWLYTHREFPEGSHMGAAEVFMFTSGICMRRRFCYLKPKQLVRPPPPSGKTPPLVFPIGLGLHPFIWDVGQQGPSLQLTSERGSGGLGSGPARLTSSPCSSSWEHWPTQGPRLTGLPSTAPGKLCYLHQWI